MVWWQQPEAERSVSSKKQRGSRKGEQEVESRKIGITGKPIPSDVLPPASLHPLKVPIPPQIV